MSHFIEYQAITNHCKEQTIIIKNEKYNPNVKKQTAITKRQMNVIILVNLFMNLPLITSINKK